MLLSNFLKFIAFSFSLSNVYSAFDFKEDQIIQDDEVESFLEEILGELFLTAGVSSKPKIILYVTSEVNAGATYGGYILVTTGFLMKCKNAKELVGVLAHETGHIKGAHLHKDYSSQASVPALAALALGGAFSVVTGNPGPVMAVLQGSAQIWERGMLKHSREQEESADASAVKILKEKNWPIDGLASFLGVLDSLYGGRENAYASTHPLSIERKQKVESAGSGGKLPDIYEIKFQRVRAKIYGFMSPKKVNLEYKGSDFYSSYAKSISLFQIGDRLNAIKKIDELLKTNPNDIYLFEIKGQMLFDSGKVKESVECFKKAISLHPKKHQFGISIQLAEAIIESGENIKDAIKILNVLLESDKENIFILKLLASAYGKIGDQPCASVFLARIAMLEGNNAEAKKRLSGSASKCTNKVLKAQMLDMKNSLEQN